MAAGNRKAAMKGYLAPLVVAFVAFAAVFVAIDIAIMKLHGLTLIFDR